MEDENDNENERSIVYSSVRDHIEFSLANNDLVDVVEEKQGEDHHWIDDVEQTHGDRRTFEILSAEWSPTDLRREESERRDAFESSSDCNALTKQRSRWNG